MAAAAWSNRSPRAEIRVAEGTLQGSTNRPVHSASSLTTVNQLVIAQELQISTPSQSMLGDLSPPTRGGALVRIISLSVPHWPTAAPHPGGAVVPVRRPQLFLHVASLPKSNRVNVEKAIQELRAEDWNREAPSRQVKVRAANGW